ncbi:MAG: YfhO family protein [Euryarchaeota archaeon]|nr:YfhO family protein [Euryarchaeota archaeon]
MARPATERAYILLVAGFSILAITPLLKPGFFASDDMLAPVYRLVELDACLGDGVLFPRWFPDLYGGRGAPFFNYYAPLAYYAAEAFHLLGLGYADSVKAVYGASFPLSGVFMYLYLRQRAGPPGALVGAVLYMYAPYRFVDVYVRGTLAESFSFVLFPLVLYLLDQALKDPGVARLNLLALAYACLVLTHNVMALVFTCFLALYWAVLGRGGHRVKAGLGLAAGLALSAFFWLPALGEMGYVKIERALLGFGYAGPLQLLPELAGFPQRQIELNFQLGIFSILALLYAAFFLRDRYSRFFLGLSALAIFLVLPYSGAIWRHLPLAGFVQFSWRLLALVALSSSVLGGLAVHRMDMPGKRAALLCLLVALSSSPFIGLRGTVDFDPGELTPQGLRNLNAGLTYADEYMPVDATHLPVREGRVEVRGGQAGVLDIREGCSYAALDIVTATGSTIAVDLYYFPGWTAYVDGARTQIEKDGTGRVLLDVPRGRHLVLLRFEDTPLRRIATALSLATLALMALLSARSLLRQYPPGRQDAGGRGDAQ